MALVQRSFRLSAFVSRAFSTRAKDIQKSVFISQSNDVYANLALEDWLYKKFDFSSHHVLLLWQNDPCVVIGRHQNPWVEANVPDLGQIAEGVKLARRNSGGGAVYHDLGNLNMTFFTARENYNRKYNLEIVARALFREFGLKVEISPREDLLLRGCKVSGTAAKLGRSNAYHHCTLLVCSDKVSLSQSLQKDDLGIETNATKSTKSKIINLCEENPKIEVPNLLTAIGFEYLRTYALALEDGGMDLANKQTGFHMANPTDYWYPGIEDIKKDLESWEWRFGKTPKFTMTRSFRVPDSFLLNGDIPDDLRVTLVVEKGKIVDVNLFFPTGFAVTGYTGKVNVITSLVGRKFSEDTLDNLESSLGPLISDKDKFVTDCVRQVMQSV